MTFNLLKLTAITFSLQASLTPAFADPLPHPTTKPVAITWNTAKKHIGDTVTVTGPVISTHRVNSGKWLTLNVGKDYPDTDRLLILIKGDLTESDYKNKKITVSGKVVLYNGMTQLVVTPADITVNSELPKPGEGVTPRKRS